MDTKKSTGQRSREIERSSRYEDKSGKIERRYSRRDARKADGVTEVTSLEMVKNWSREAAALPTTPDRHGQINLRNARSPSRKSTKVIFARYSQDSMDDVSDRSECVAIRDDSENESWICDDDLSSGCVRFLENFNSLHYNKYFLLSFVYIDPSTKYKRSGGKLEMRIF